jgi:succinate-semialdehyde dehydrogenase/glutarate-semialdehyde dehydrogenase
MDISNTNLLKTQAFIGGWVDVRASAFPVLNPANGEEIAQVTDCGEGDVLRAIEVAEAALPTWSTKTAKERAVILKRWYDLIVANADDLAAILTAEQGKPLAEARGEILYGASFIEWFAEEGKRAYGDIIPSTIPDTRIFVQRQPVGVCAFITPWNFPSAMITRKLGAALAAGCTAVCKPAAETPLSALALVALAEEAGVPTGVVNVVTGTDSKMIGRVLCDSPIVRKLSFTGSTAVGKVLMAQCAGTVKKLSLELGGNAPFIVFDDADIDVAVAGAIICKYRNAGQTCVCANRIYIQDGVYEEFVEKFTAAVEALKVGAGDQDGVTIGPMINVGALDKVQEHIADAVEQGGTLLSGGNAHALGGAFFEPTVIRDATASMKVAQEETFGPLAPLFRFTDEADVIKQANDTNYGLASYFYAKDMARIWRVSEGLEFGMVGVNTPILSTEVAPFGGIKESGVGREGSRYGLDDFLEMKYLLMHD